MTDDECVAFLQWCLPRMGMRWRGFRKVRRQVRRRIAKRMAQLGLGDLAAYRDRLEAHPHEWTVLDPFCRISVSRFYRDKAVFRHLGDRVIPSLATMAVDRNDRQLRCWSIGCASGEEPYTLAIIWSRQLAAQFPQLEFQILATDADETMLDRAGRAEYPQTAVKDLPDNWVAGCFQREGSVYGLLPDLQSRVHFLQQDIRHETPVDHGGEPTTFDLVLCRNLAFTYFDEPTQRQVLGRIEKHIIAGGMLVIGKSESLPDGDSQLACYETNLKIFQRDTGQYV
jgi:chemotaxis protein methyltransferase CheR